MMKNKEKTREQLLKDIKAFKKRITELEKFESRHKELRQVVIDSNRRLQESAQKLRQENERILAEQKRMIGQSEIASSAKDKKEGRKGVEKISKKILLKYDNLLDLYIKNDRKRSDVLVDELCKNFISNDTLPKTIVELHIASVKKVADDINREDAQRKVSAVRMVLLMVMTRYASLLRERH